MEVIKFHKTSWAACIVLLFVFLGGNSAVAQDEDQWQFEFTLYGWYSGVDADIQLPAGPGTGQGVTIDASNIIDNLEMIFMGTFEARRDRWALVADVIYMDVGGDKSQNLFTPGNGLPVNASVGVDMTSWVISGGVGYDVVQNSQGTLGIVGGARYLAADVDVTVGVKGPFGLVNPSAGVSESENYLDGFVGIRGAINLNENWYLPYYADIGTGQSDLTWQAMAGVGYRFGWGDIRLAYRYLSYDFGDDKVLKDLALSGPILGVGIRF